MRRTRLWRLLWMSFFLELQDVAESKEDKYERIEGQTLEVECPFNVGLYHSSQKEWQKLTEGEKPRTLARTERSSGQTNQVQVGRYFLEDIPSEGLLVVQMTDLRQEDSGLYQCVIYQPPKEPMMLYRPVRLVVKKELQDVAESNEDKYERIEGQTLEVECPFNVGLYHSSQKEWQKLTEGEKPQTLARTERSSGQTIQVRVGRYFLEDIPSEGLLVVQMTDLRQEDSGLYQCVIYQPPKEPMMLYHPVRLVVKKELQDVAESKEDKYERIEGQTLEVECPFNVGLYHSSQKEWQKLTEGEKPQTLARTERSSGQTNQVRVGRYFLEDIPSEGLLVVQMTDLRQEDSGLYQCVIYQPPKEPMMLYRPVRLVVKKDPVSDSNSTESVTEIPTVSPITTKARGKLPISPSTVTQPLSTSTVSLSSPDLKVNSTRGTAVIRVSPISIITIVVCGILIKSLVFTVLLVVTQRSFGP